ncbi:MAG: contractile injection system tape measure protein [Serratia sp. (in: enterobacteria)]|uniref:contractile injection system tape measure protein n=1 Tax=Serratia sp. (in: enterobacteria) TaxID=616 RepID=UPI003F2B2ECA
MAHVLIYKVRCKIRMDRRLSGEKILQSVLLGSDNLKSALLQGLRNNATKISLRLNTLALDLGAISVAQFDTQFNQRLVQAFTQCLAREHASIGGPQEMNLQIPDITALRDWFVECHPGEEDLFQRAQGCLQPATIKSLIQDSPAYQLQQLLKLLLEGAWQSSKVLPVFWFGRVTASRLSIAAIVYLLNSQRGHDWLMHQHAPIASQVTDWAKAIAQGEVPPEQVAELLTGNRPSDSLLLGQPAYPALIVMRWLLPLWRQPAVRKVIHRLKGGRGVQRLDAYLSRCLQRQDDDVMQEEKEMHSLPDQGASLQDNTVLSPDGGMESGAQQVILPPENSALPQGRGMPSDALLIELSRDNAMLPECGGIPAASRRTMQPGKSGLRSPNEPRSSSQGIGNAGLLLLWPLLPQLFSQLGLWEEEQFVSEAAQRQAVYGLDQLVWGVVSPTEGRLTLNQMLCGVSGSTDVPPSPPLSLLQLQQIDDWLAAIGQQLPGWQKLSLTDIRQLFLQRTGEISIEGPVPQISVWPEPYDFLLRDWPWPMTLASFPWTEQPLTIVWPLDGFTG